MEVNIATSKNLVVKSTMFPHRDIHKYTWTSPDGKTNNQIDHVLIDRRWPTFWEGIVGTGWSGLRIGTGGGHLGIR
jgi:hypothetical protein